jgi:hypothetical protein
MIINTLDNQIVNLEFATAKDAHEWVDSYFDYEDVAESQEE